MSRVRALLVGLALAGLALPAGPSYTPALAAAREDSRFADAFARLDAWVAEGAFPGAVLAVGDRSGLLALRSFGRIEATAGAAPMRADTIFDLASLTKVVATTTAAMMLIEQGKLDLDAPVVRYLPSFAAGPGHDRILIRHLLAHSSGLSREVQLWRDTTDPAAMRRIIDTMPMGWPVGTHFQYRDENMILLADVIELVSGERLDRFAARHLFTPLGMRDTRFNPPARLRARIAPTEVDTVWRKRLLRGEVHDENAFALGGVAGHAGLFSTARDLSRFAQMILDGGRWRGRQLVRQATIDLFATPQFLPPGSSRALGWDTPGATKGFAGPLASPAAIMHTGFTGTSLYIDRARGAYVILLTNRVNPTRENRLIGEARRDIHTAVLAALDAGGLAARH